MSNNASLLPPYTDQSIRFLVSEERVTVAGLGVPGWMVQPWVYLNKDRTQRVFMLRSAGHIMTSQIRKTPILLKYVWIIPLLAISSHPFC